MQYRITGFFFILLLVTVACTNNDFKKSKSGLEYKFIEENRDEANPQIGDIVTLQLRFENERGTIIEESAVFKISLQEPSHSGGSIEDAIALMHKGDSGIFRINAIDYYTKTREIQPPVEYASNENLIFYIRVLDVLAYEEYQKGVKLSVESDKREEETLLKAYLIEKNIIVEPTMSGLYFIEIKSGEGKIPSPGKKVRVHYKGSFIDGSPFDSSYDREEPFVFDFGIGQVIQGWDEGIALMQVGGKYELIIPSYLAYGDKQRGPIPPNSTLIFEIELLDAE